MCGLNLTIKKYDEDVSADQFREIDYIYQIIDFYQKSQSNKSITQREIDIWQSKMFISLIRKIHIIFPNEIKNIILLIMILFKKKEESDIDLCEIPENQKKLAIEKLSSLI